mgnify:FL=1
MKTLILKSLSALALSVPLATFATQAEVNLLEMPEVLTGGFPAEAMLAVRTEGAVRITGGLKWADREFSLEEILASEAYETDEPDYVLFELVVDSETLEPLELPVELFIPETVETGTYSFVLNISPEIATDGVGEVVEPQETKVVYNPYFIEVEKPELPDIYIDSIGLHGSHGFQLSKTGQWSHETRYDDIRVNISLGAYGKTLYEPVAVEFFARFSGGQRIPLKVIDETGVQQPSLMFENVCEEGVELNPCVTIKRQGTTSAVVRLALNQEFDSQFLMQRPYSKFTIEAHVDPDEWHDEHNGASYNNQRGMSVVILP